MAVTLPEQRLLVSVGTVDERVGAQVVDADGTEVARSEECPGLHGEATAGHGDDAAVVEFLRAEPLARALEDAVVGFVETWLPHLRHGERGTLHVALGCTGGRHRSVYMADAVAARLRAGGHTVMVRHRDLWRA